MKRISGSGLDAMDLMLIDKLENNGKKSPVDLARELNSTRATVNKKIQRLLETGAIEFHTVVNSFVLGYTTVASFGVNTLPGKANAVANQLASFENVSKVLLTTGRHDIFIWAVFPNNQNILHFLSHKLGNIPNVVSAESFITLRNIRDYWGTEWLYTAAKGDGLPGQQNGPYKINEIDLSIIRELELDPRATTVAISKKLGISQPNAHRRLRLLLDKKVVQVHALANQPALGYNISGLTFVKVELSKVTDVANHLLTMPAVKHVTITTGSFSLVFWARFRDSNDLHEFLSNELGAIPGVLSHETSIITKAEGKINFSPF